MTDALPSLPSTLVRRIPCSQSDEETLLTREWLVGNGLGGYASGTLAGVATRRYHGLLIAALPFPQGRVVMLNHLAEQVRLADRTTTVGLGGEERGGALEILGAKHLVEFRLESGLPTWRYRIGDLALEKRLFLPYRQNTVHVRYRLLEGTGPLRLKLRPSMHFRPHDAPVSAPLSSEFQVVARGRRYEISAGEDFPTLRLVVDGVRTSFTLDEQRLPEFLYRVERHRGYEAQGDLWSPGHFRLDLDVGQEATLIASTESWATLETLSSDVAEAAEHDRRHALLARADRELREGFPAELVLAADAFLVTPAGRYEDATRAHAEGDEARTVIAGYHWFTDWGRDTMISLEGLALATGREVEAGYILRTFGHYVRDGLIPNLFPEGQHEGLYHTADATLWFFHALHRYLARTGDFSTLERLLPTLKEIYEAHVRGTRFGIGADPRDGLLRQGAEGYQLTWMDAKVDGWVVTPRRGKAVEINALWYNALRLLGRWLGEREDALAPAVDQLAGRVEASFNRRFWYAEGGHLYDVVDGEQGDDASLRPNQLFAISLDHPVLDRTRWPAVLEVVERELVTPLGLRTLSRAHPDYKPRYFGDLRARDAAYHQGTVWAWLMGPYLDAWLKVHPGELATARARLGAFDAHLSEAGIGTVSEVFDAESPFTPRACIAQAWSVAELIRCWASTEAPA